MSKNKLYELFENPPVIYRGQPFWSWNEVMESEELANQVRDMKEQGMGGFFMHSRDGLETGYMGPEWMKCIRDTVDVSKEEGMLAWLYDEDRFPSGNAGGKVVQIGGDKYKLKTIVMDVCSEYNPIPEAEAVFKAVLEGNRILSAEQLSKDIPHASNEPECLLVFRWEICMEEPYYNDNVGVDNLNPEAVACFIDETHEKYFKEVGSEFGKTVPGIFADEINIQPGRVKSEPLAKYNPADFDKRRLPWTWSFNDYFSEKRGYSLLDRIPYLFFDGEDSRKIRHDYWMTVADRFTESFTKQIADWCESHNLAFTGHYSESDIGIYIWSSATAMGHYRYQHIPGIDILFEKIVEHLGVKQCTSVANQFGRKYVLSETYGAAGWGFTFEGQKWMGDWQYVMGVNVRCQHLAMYSIKGCRKRDYPQMFGPYAPWWKYNKVVEDYFARLGAVISEGTRVCDLLVLHPLSTAWSMMSDKTYHAVSKWGWHFSDFIRKIMGMHFDFDLGDETIIRDFGSVSDGKFTVNMASYKVVIIPELDTLFGSTVDLLENFLNSGGNVIAIGKPAWMVDALPSNRVSELMKHRNVIMLKDSSTLEDTLQRLIPRTVSIINPYYHEDADILLMEREHERDRIVFAVNTDREKEHKTRINFSYTGKVEELDPLNGSIHEVGINLHEDCSGMYMDVDFGKADSKLYIVKPEEKPLLKTETVARVKTGIWYMGAECKFERTWPNALVLDFCSYSIDGEPWSESMEVWMADKEIRERFGMKQFAAFLAQRYIWINTPHLANGTPVRFRYTFDVVDVPEKPVYLVVEDLEKYEYSLNGKKLQAVREGYYMDRAFGKLHLPNLIEGVNEIIISCAYKESLEIEDSFIVGDFGVDTGRRIIREKDTIHFGDWCLQGYMHYNGSIIYKGELNWNGTGRPVDGSSVNKNWEGVSDSVSDKEAELKVMLKPGAYSATVMEVRVNGQHAGYIPWHSVKEVDITPHLVLGINQIEIEVAGSPRNTLGPLHNAAGNDEFTENMSFRRIGTENTSSYTLMPYGLFEQVSITCYKVGKSSRAKVK